jgi:hypothetical protein
MSNLGSLLDETKSPFGQRGNAGIALMVAADSSGSLRDPSGTEYDLTQPQWVLAGRYPRRLLVTTADAP